MPEIWFPEGRVLEMDFVEGQEGLDGVDPRLFGRALAELHDIRLPDPPPIETGVAWLVELATRNLRLVGRSIPSEVVEDLLGLPQDVIVHGEPSNVITRPDGELRFVDWDQCGLGTRYQDLGHAYLFSIAEPWLDFESVLGGYGEERVNRTTIRRMAGLSLLAAARWADFDQRIARGLEVLADPK